MTRLSQPLALTSLLLLAACSAPSMDASLQYSPQSLSGGVRTDTTAGAAEKAWGGVGLDGSADAAHITADNGRDKATADVDTLDDLYVCCFCHGVCGFDECQQAFGFD